MARGRDLFEELADALGHVRRSRTWVGDFVALRREAAVIIEEGWLGACKDGRDRFLPVR